MNPLDYIRGRIEELDTKEFYRFYAIAMGILIAIIAIILYVHFRSVSAVQAQLKQINKQRVEVRSVLQEHELVKQQQREVDNILAKDPTFKIKEYFSTLMKELGLERNMTKSVEVSEPQDLNNGYSEIKLEGSFTDLNMKQLANLLYKVEQNERIYTKELMITKALKSPTIDVTLIIATLQPQAT